MQNDLTQVRGMVLKHAPVGDYDWVVTILTIELGKITAFAKGARKPSGKLSGNVEPFCYGTFKLYAGRTSYNIVEADIQNYFESFRMDLDGAIYGTFFLEIADYYCHENDIDTALLGLLYMSLRALETDSIDNRLVRCIYEIKSLSIEGEYPGPPLDRRWQDATVYTMDFIVKSSVQKLYTFSVKDDILHELMNVTDIFRKRFIDRQMKSFEMVSSLENNVEKL
ncbi:MAG: DNA repair protein RecO [Butyrivibrio sp.]|nr:DNA repair protein RecO [Butyrivibrio sp.]